MTRIITPSCGMRLLLSGLALVPWSLAVADVDLPTKFSNLNSIVNTRHNLTQAPIGAGATNMNPYRNDYGEICVYCHTPHGANADVAVPLWNHTIQSTTYTTYDTLGTSSLTQTVVQPGVSSLVCLSCHDGTLGVDSIINMPGSGRYDASQTTSQSNTFLNDNWDNPSGADATTHLGLAGDDTPADEDTGCLACHSSDAGIVGAGATNFKVFAIGTVLTNDHPVGIELPAERLGVDFNDPDEKQTTIAFFDNDGDANPDPAEIRFYNSDDGYLVECASCHDPHGVKGVGGAINPSFLRVLQDGSGVCYTCHAL